MKNQIPSSDSDDRTRLAATVRELRIWQRFHIRLTAIFGGLVFLVLSAGGWFLYSKGVQMEMEGLRARLRAMAVSIASAVPPEAIAALRTKEDLDSPAHALLTSRFASIGKNEHDVTSIYIFRRGTRDGWLVFVCDWVVHGQPGVPGQEYDLKQAPGMVKGFDAPFAETEIYTDEWGPVLSGYAPVRGLDGSAIAVLGVDLPATRVAEVKRAVLRLLLTLYGAAALLLGFVAVALGRNVREPLGRIIEATSAIAAGRLDARAKLLRSDEFGILGQHFDQMAAGLQEREFIRATFGRYVSEDVARKLLANPEGTKLGGEEREVTVLFADLRNYSTISETLSPQQVVGMLNAFLGAMGELVDKHHGVVIEFLGDAILAVFNAPNDLPNHAERATACAIAMRDRLRVLNAEWDAAGLSKLWKERGVPAIAARIGVHTGNVVAGNLGSDSRVKYAVIGDAVNLASRVENLSSTIGTDILITAETLARVPTSISTIAVDKGEHVVKGRASPVHVYTFGTTAA